MRKDMQVQIHRINVDKWLEGIRIRRDPGKEFVIRWISKNAKWFRKAWNVSLCQNCRNWKECGYKLHKKCTDYIDEDTFNDSTDSH